MIYNEIKNLYFFNVNSATSDNINPKININSGLSICFLDSSIYIYLDTFYKFPM